MHFQKLKIYKSEWGYSSDEGLVIKFLWQRHRERNKTKWGPLLPIKCIAYDLCFLKGSSWMLEGTEDGRGMESRRIRVAQTLR